MRGNRCLFMSGACFCMGTIKHDVVVVLKMGAYIHGCLESQFYDIMIVIPFKK